MSWLSIGTNIYYNYPALQCSSLIPHQQSKNEIKVIIWLFIFPAPFAYQAERKVSFI